MSTLCLCSAHMASCTASRRLQRSGMSLSASFLPALKPLVESGLNFRRSTLLPGSTRNLFIVSPWGRENTTGLESIPISGKTPCDTSRRADPRPLRGSVARGRPGLGEGGRPLLWRPGGADRRHAPHPGGGEALDQRGALSPCPQLLHAPAWTRGAAARHLHRLAAQPHAGR